MSLKVVIWREIKIGINESVHNKRLCKRMNDNCGIYIRCNMSLTYSKITLSLKCLKKR